MLVNDLVYGTLEVKDSLESPYDRSPGSVITEKKIDSEGLNVIKREDGTYYALHYEKYYGTKQLSRYSELYAYGNKFFRYNYTDALVTMLSKASEEEIAEEQEWKENHNGKGLFDLLEIDGTYYYKWESVGLSKEHWDDEECRKEYLSQYVNDVEEECSYLAEEFIEYEGCEEVNKMELDYKYTHLGYDIWLIVKDGK